MLGFKLSVSRLALFMIWLIQYYTFGSSILWIALSFYLLGSVVLGCLTYDYDYWIKRGVFSPPAVPFVGHIKTVVTFQEQGGMCFKRIYDTYKNFRFLGTHQFYQRTLVMNEPALIRRVCVNDFHHFTDRGFFFNKEIDPLAGSVLFLRGNEWRKLRVKVSPIFTSIKLRGMIPLIEDAANEFLIRMEKLLTNNARSGDCEEISKILGKIDDDKEEVLEDNSKVVDTEKLLGGFTADAIVPCAFGLKSNVMDNEDDPFAVALKAFYAITPYNLFEKTMRQFWPAFVMFFKMRIVPRKSHDFFFNIVTSVLRAREMGVQEKRGDFIDMMMTLRNDDKNNNNVKNEDHVEITDMVISANAFIILLGGFETTSSILAFMFLELAAHPEVQRKLRKEIVEVMQKYNGQVSYEMIQDLEYTEMVIQETLRLYPPFPCIQRMCTKDYQIPDSDVIIEKGTIIVFPNLGLQRDSQYFESGDEFIPERWTEGMLESLPPGVYMPFGDGPRYCIGKRFAKIQMKICLVKVLPRIHMSPGPDSPPRTEPFKADPKSPLTFHPIDSTLKFTYIPVTDINRFC